MANKYIIIQVEEVVGRNLKDKEIDAVSEMNKLGCTIRQMASKVNQIQAIEIGNARREVYLRRLKRLGTALNEQEMNKFKMQQDKNDGVTKDWEKMGYPAAYRIALNEPKKKQKKSKKETKKESKKTKKTKTKTVKNLARLQE